MVLFKSSAENGDSENEDEEEIFQRGTKRKCLVISDEEDSSSGSEESDVDTEGEDDSGDDSRSDIEEDDNEATDSEDYETESESEDVDCGGQDESPQSSYSKVTDMTKSNIKRRAVISDDSDSGSDTTPNDQTCAICLGRMKGQIGSPELCDHCFCLDCILEWSKSNNSCPQDRIPFFQVFVRKRVKGRIIRRIAVQEIKPDDIPEEPEEDPTFCEICGRCDREDTLLLCDGCDLGFHMDCLTPPLSQVPVEQWFCTECVVTQAEKGPTPFNVEVSEVTELLDEAQRLIGDYASGSRFIQGQPVGSGHRRPRRRVPRTRETERVLGRITRGRETGNLISDAVFGHLRQFDISDEEEEDDIGTDSNTEDEEDDKNARKPVKRRRITKKRKTTRKRKTTTKKSGTKKRVTKTKTKTTKKTTTTQSGTTSSKKVTRRKKTVRRRKGRRKGKKRRYAKIVRPLITPKARLAEALGIKVGPLPNTSWQLSNYSIPKMTSGKCKKTDGEFGSSRMGGAGPSLSLLGNTPDLDYSSIPDEYGDAILLAGVRRAVPTTPQAIARRKLHAANTLNLSQPTQRFSYLSTPISEAHVSSISDVLGGIFESQNELLKKHRPLYLKGGGNLGRTHGLGGPDQPYRDGGSNAGGGGGGGGGGGDNNSQNYNQGQQSSGGYNYNSSSGGGGGGGGGGGFSQDGYGRSGERSLQPPPLPPTLPLGCLPLGVVAEPENEDPTGSKAYSSFLDNQKIFPENSDEESNHSNNSYVPEGLKEFEEEQEVDEPVEPPIINEDTGVRNDVDIYSDIEPEAIAEEDVYSDDAKEAEEEDGNFEEHNQQEEEDHHSSDGDDLVIDVNRASTVIKPNYLSNPYDERLQNAVLLSNTAENEVGSTTLPGLPNFELDAVSDTDTQEMEKSMNSSISLSDSNMGDAEVTSSTNEPAQTEFDLKASKLFGEVKEGMGLQTLETEVISDNEEMCFDDNVENNQINDENIEEGEIPNELAPKALAPKALPSIRPKINMNFQMRRTIDSTFSKGFDDGDNDYEEGEIVDENKEQKKREKARREVDEVVNQPLDDVLAVVDEVAEVINVNFVGEHGLAPPVLLDIQAQPIEQPAHISEPELSSPEKEKDTPEPVLLPGTATPPREKKEKRKEKKDKGKEKDKNKEKTKEKVKDKEKEEKKDDESAFKKISKNNKVRNYRDNDKENRNHEKDNRNHEKDNRNHEKDNRNHEKDNRNHEKENRNHEKENRHNDKDNRRHDSRERGLSKDRHDRGRDKGRNAERYSDRDRFDAYRDLPKRREMERYNVRQMINKKEEERKKKDEFGRDVALRSDRPSRSKSRDKGGKGKKKTQKNRRSRSRSPKKKGGRRSYSYTSSSRSSSSSSSSSYSSSSSTSRSRSRKRKKRSKSLTKKKGDKKKGTKAAKKAKLAGKGDQGALGIPKKKGEKKKDKKKGKDAGVLPQHTGPKGKVNKRKNKGKKNKAPQSKEVFQAGGSIMVSVNFSRKEKERERKKKDKEMNQEKRRKDREVNPTAGSPFHGGAWPQPSSPGDGKRTPLQDEPMWSPEQNSAVGNKSPGLVDLDCIMLTPPPQEPIMISDSDEDEGITRLPVNLGLPEQRNSLHRTIVIHQGGPKTPPGPEPGVKFTLSSKQVLKPINNPLMEDDEDDIIEEVPPTSRGPNTPPGAPPESDDGGRPKSPMIHPGSPAGTPSSPEPDAYDPFDPTKSPSPSRASPQQEARVTSSDQKDSDKSMEKSPQKTPSKASSSGRSVISVSPDAPPLPEEPLLAEERPPEPKKNTEVVEIHKTPLSAALKSPVKTTKISSINTSQPPPKTSVPTSKLSMGPPLTVPPTQSLPNIGPTPISLGQTLTPVQQLFSGLPSNVANILYPAALAAAAVRGATLLRNNTQVTSSQQTVLAPDFTRPPPNLNRPPPNLPKDKRNGHPEGLLDMDMGSPFSPDSDNISDIFEPPSPHHNNLHAQKGDQRNKRSQKKPQGGNNLKETFDSLFGSDRKKSSMNAPQHRNSKQRGARSKPSAKKNFEGETDDIPSSAVELQLLRKVQRQERVVDEVKTFLKPHYNRKSVTKEDYKEIMKKCVLKVCHNKTGEINPKKIGALVDGYVKKVKYYRKKTRGDAGGDGGPPSISKKMKKVTAGFFETQTYPACDL